MKTTDTTLSGKDLTEARARRAKATHLQGIESNPLDAEDVAMFEMFEREQWPHARRLAYIREKAQAAAMVHAAE